MHQAYHVPVLMKEVIDGLGIIASGIYVDCTFGGGGHSERILDKLNSDGKLIVFDQDEDARKNVPDDPRVIFVPHNFRHLQRFLRFHKIVKVNGILADLRVISSMKQKVVFQRGSMRHWICGLIKMKKPLQLIFSKIIQKKNCIKFLNNMAR